MELNQFYFQGCMVQKTSTAMSAHSLKKILQNCRESKVLLLINIANLQQKLNNLANVGNRVPIDGDFVNIL